MINITPNSPEAYRLLHDGILALARAERLGMRIDLDYVDETKMDLTRRIGKLQKELEASSFYRHWEHTTKGVPNIGSNTQLANFLYNIRKIRPAKFTESGGGSTDDEALKALDLPELDLILQIRKLKKIRDTYLEAFAREQVNGVLHPQFNLHTVVSYRSSSDKPNFQNIPKRDKEAMAIVRNAIFPREGNQLMEVDFSGLEVSIAACYHEDPVMIKYLTDPSTDMHGDMTEQIFCLKDFNRRLPEHNYLRAATKNCFIFPQFYGDYYKNNAISFSQWTELPSSGPWKTAQGVKLPGGGYLSNHLRSCNISCFDDFVTHLQKIEQDFWRRRFKVYGKWKEKFHEMYLKEGTVCSYTGFTFRGEMRRNEVINYPVQSAAFHCLLWCFIELDKRLTEGGYRTRLIGQIHDAVVLDVHPEELNKVSKLVKRITTKELAKAWKWINVPLSVEADLGPVDGSWASLESYKLP